MTDTIAQRSDPAPDRSGDGRTRWASYENKLLAVLSVAEGSMFVDRLALGILTPFIVAELQLSNFQVGLLASVFSITYAIAGYVGGLASDRAGKRRAFLIAHVFAFSVLSAASGFAMTFAVLLAVRALLGLAEGPVLPLLQSIMIPASSLRRRAFNSAFLQNVAPFVMGQFAAPIVLTHLAQLTDWRVTFFLTAVPGLLLLPLMAILVKDPAVAAHATRGPADAAVGVWRNRNLMLCAGMACCTGTWIYMFNTFLPLYLVNSAHYSTLGMGYVASLLGVGGCLASLVLPAWSDRVGRKPVLLLGFALGGIAPLCLLLAPNSPMVLVVGVLIGSAVLGLTPLTITLVPADSVPADQLGRAIGLTSAASAIIGGMLMTTIAGKLADAFGLQAPFVLAVAACLVAMVLVTGLQAKPAISDKGR